MSHPWLNPFRSSPVVQGIKFTPLNGSPASFCFLCHYFLSGLKASSSAPKCYPCSLKQEPSSLHLRRRPSTLKWNTASSGRLSLTLHQLTEHPLCAEAASSAAPTQTPSNPLHLHYSANSDFPIDKFLYCMFLLYQSVLQACNLKQEQWETHLIHSSLW